MSNAPRLGGSRAAYDGPDSPVRRIASFCLCSWIGMSILIQVVTLVGFDSLQNVSAAPPACYAKAVKLAGQPVIHELLRYQAAADTRAMLDLWGWIQLGLALGLFLLLLMFSSAGRARVGFSLALLIDAVLIAFVLIPRMDSYERQLAPAPAGQTLAMLIERTRLANLAFVLSQSVALLLCLILLALLRRGRASHRTEPL